MFSFYWNTIIQIIENSIIFENIIKEIVTIYIWNDRIH